MQYDVTYGGPHFYPWGEISSVVYMILVISC